MPKVYHIFLLFAMSLTGLLANFFKKHITLFNRKEECNQALPMTYEVKCYRYRFSYRKNICVSSELDLSVQ